MGGFSSILGKVGTAAGEVLEKTEPVRALKNGFDATPAGQFLYKIIKEDYEPAVDKMKQHLVDQVKAGATPIPAHEIENKARNMARVHAFGTNDAIGATAIKWASQTHGLEAAQSLADHLHVYLQDTVEKENRNSFGQVIRAGNKGAGTKTVSRFKENVIKNKENQVPLNTTATYTPKTDLEKKFQSRAVTVMAPAIAISHLSTPFNIMLGSPLRSLAKGLSDVTTPGNYQATKKALLDTGIFAQTSMQMYREQQEWSSGKIAKYAGPKLGYYLNKAMHAPGFNALRSWSLAFAGATAKNSAEHFAQRLVQNPGDKLARMSLSEMGIEPGSVLKQGGQLAPEQYEKAIYRFVDDHIFLNTKLDRSYLGQSNPWFRTATMFHSYVAAQGHLMSRELTKMYKTGDIPNAVQTLATIGIIFPSAGHLIGKLEREARGQTWDDPNYDSDTAIEKYLDDMSHMAGFGVAQSYVRGTLRQHLSDVMIGPIGNVAVRGLQDAASLAFNLKHDPKPLERDILQYSLPDNLGKILSHKLLPTTKEEREKHPHMKKLKTNLKGLSQ